MTTSTHSTKWSDAIDKDALVRVVERLRAGARRNRTVFIAGNGGSAATASHSANDLGKAAKHREPASVPRSMSLGDNASWLTALANDEGYERVFAGQLENFADAGDVLIVISASGNSPNLVAGGRACARARDVETIGFLGFDGGRLLDLVDEAVWVQIGSQARTVSSRRAHALLCDIVTTCLIADRDEPTPTAE